MFSIKGPPPEINGNVGPSPKLRKASRDEGKLEFQLMLTACDTDDQEGEEEEQVSALSAGGEPKAVQQTLVNTLQNCYAPGPHGVPQPPEAIVASPDDNSTVGASTALPVPSEMAPQVVLLRTALSVSSQPDQTALVTGGNTNATISMKEMQLPQRGSECAVISHSQQDSLPRQRQKMVESVPVIMNASPINGSSIHNIQREPGTSPSSDSQDVSALAQGAVDASMALSVLSEMIPPAVLSRSASGILSQSGLTALLKGGNIARTMTLDEVRLTLRGNKIAVIAPSDQDSLPTRLHKIVDSLPAIMNAHPTYGSSIQDVRRETETSASSDLTDIGELALSPGRVDAAVPNPLEIAPSPAQQLLTLLERAKPALEMAPPRSADVQQVSEVKMLRLKLRPNALGEVEVILRRSSRQLRIEVMVTEQSAANALQADMEFLKERISGLLHAEAAKSVSIVVRTTDSASTEVPLFHRDGGGNPGHASSGSLSSGGGDRPTPHKEDTSSRSRGRDQNDKSSPLRPASNGRVV